MLTEVNPALFMVNGITKFGNFVMHLFAWIYDLIYKRIVPLPLPKSTVYRLRTHYVPELLKMERYMKGSLRELFRTDLGI